MGHRRIPLSLSRARTSYIDDEDILRNFDPVIALSAGDKAFDKLAAHSVTAFFVVRTSLGVRSSKNSEPLLTCSSCPLVCHKIYDILLFIN